MYEEIKQWAQILNESEKEEKEYKEACEAFEAEVDEAMPIDDILKRGEQRKADREREEAERMAQRANTAVKSIWIKNIRNSPDNQARIADIEIEYKTGEKENIEFDVTPDPTDKYYKRVAQSLRAVAKGHTITNDDIALSLVRINFNDPSIRWFYGKNKATDKKWWLDDEITKQSKTGQLRNIKKTAAASPRRTVKRSWQDDPDDIDAARMFRQHGSNKVRYTYDPSVITSEADKIDEAMPMPSTVKFNEAVKIIKNVLDNVINGNEDEDMIVYIADAYELLTGDSSYRATLNMHG